MSVMGTIVSNFLSATNTTAFSSGATTLSGFKPLTEIKTDELPHISAYAFTYGLQEFKIAQQEVRLYGFTFRIVTRAQTKEQMLTYIDGVQTTLATGNNRRLSGACDWCWVESWILADRVDSEATTDRLEVAELAIVAQRII